MTECDGTDAANGSVSPARPAASVILLRQSDAGVEVYMVRRPARAAAFADAYVFPGGSVGEGDFRIHPGDVDFTDYEALRELSRRGGTAPSDAVQAIALWHAALRELFEEAGVLLALDANGRHLRVGEDDASRFADYRRAVQAGQVSLGDVLVRERLSLDYRRLIYFSHWITPSRIPRRFDTRFFVAEMPVDQKALHIDGETTDGAWIQPEVALERADHGHFPIVYPTRMHLARVAPYRSVQDLLVFSRQKSIHTVQPTRSATQAIEAAALPTEVDECW